MDGVKGVRGALHLPIIASSLPLLLLDFELPFSSNEVVPLFFIPVPLTSLSPPPFPHPVPVSCFFHFFLPVKVTHVASDLLNNEGLFF